MIIYLQAIEDPGDREKFAELYKHYRAYMLKIANEILDNAFDAEDALHNAFVSISEHMDKVQDISSKMTRGFVAIVVERKAIDIYRQRSRFVSLDAIERETVSLFRRLKMMTWRDALQNSHRNIGT